MRILYDVKKNIENNKLFFEVVNHYIGKRDFETAISVINNVANFTKDSNLQRRTQELFLSNPHCKEYFGLGENIVGSMTNMVFSGNVKIKVDKNKKAQKKIDDIYFDGYFISMLKKAYRYAISSYSGKSYMFLNTRQEYNTISNVKIRDEFVNFEVVPIFEIKKLKNILTRTFFKTVEFSDEKGKEEELFKFEYKYTVSNNGHTTLEISGYNMEDVELAESEIIDYLGIDTIYEEFDYIPFIEIDMEDGMLPNILWIEDSLAKTIFWKDEDLMSSQTHTYTPDDMLFELSLDGDEHKTFKDKYETRHITKQGIDSSEIVVVPGKSAISEIEKNLALSIIQASLDAKISPVSLGYSLIDRIASNTEVGVNRERVSIRLRENHITMLKVDIAKIIQTVLRIEGINVEIVDIAVLFDPYITPSVETATNVLSKQVQFGIKSRKRAVMELNKDELSDKEIEEEYNLIKELGTQIDYNVDQRKQAEKGESNVLKSSGVVE